MKKLNIMLLVSTLMLAVSYPVFASENNVSKLIVQGEGKVIAAPNMATIVLGVETFNISASGAATENAWRMNETIALLRSIGIAEKDIQTSSVSLKTVPQDEQIAAKEKTKAQEFVATNQVTVRLNNTGEVGEVLDAAISAGSNSIQEVNFDIRNPQPEKDKALTLAIYDARRKAEVASAAAELKLGKVLEISEGYGYVSAAAKSAVFSNVATPIQPGDLEVTASVTVTYEIS
jgi:uncharacterized protein YggE